MMSKAHPQPTHEATLAPRHLVAVALVSFLGGCGCESAPASTSEAATAKPVAQGGSEKAGEKPALCEHGVPSAVCTKCNPALAAVFKTKGDWCKEHDVPESQCTKCNPELTFSNVPASSGGVTSEPWCKEHAVPEAKCTKCRPQLIAKFVEAGDYCRKHGFPESVCPYCNPERVTAAGHELPRFPTAGTKVRLASEETEKKAGIETEKVEPSSTAKTIEVIGRLEFNQNRLARMSARGDSVVVEVKVDVGDVVKRGQALVVLASAGVGEDQSKLASAKARLEAARLTLTREDSLSSAGISSKKSVEQARAELAAAQAEYDAARAALRATGAGESVSATGQYVLSAPFDGTVVTREAVAGQTVSRELMLVEVADVDTMWAVLDVPEESSPLVRSGQRVVIMFEGLGGEKHEARIDRISAKIDPSTRTVRARVDLPNRDRRLRAGLFIRAKIEVGDEHAAILVPESAVQRAQETDLVFVRTAAHEFEPVPVKLGQRFADQIEIAQGLSSGAEVVTTGAFLLKTEILKDSIGAGCADD